MKFKKGDTLVEVGLAIGIFSMVAITVVSVISTSTSGAQSSLETTLTREEMDSQAEALRFIHDAYLSGTQSKKKSVDNKYTALWEAIKALAVDEDSHSAKLSYAPNVCAEVYNSSSPGTLNTAVTGANPFVINMRELYDPTQVDKILITESSRIFFEPETYPRVLYSPVAGSTPLDAEDDQDLYGQVNSGYRNVQRVEGIFVVAVRGQSKIVHGTTGSTTRVDDKDAYYDFYIRSCWMPVGADRATTISTVVRLYDPAVITY